MDSKSPFVRFSLFANMRMDFLSTEIRWDSLQKLPEHIHLVEFLWLHLYFGRENEDDSKNGWLEI